MDPCSPRSSPLRLEAAPARVLEVPRSLTLQVHRPLSAVSLLQCGPALPALNLVVQQVKSWPSSLTFHFWSRESPWDPVL